MGQSITNSGEHLSQLGLWDGSVVLGIEQLERGTSVLVLGLRGREFLLIE